MLSTDITPSSRRRTLPPLLSMLHVLNDEYRYFNPIANKNTPHGLPPIITTSTTSNADSIPVFPACSRTFTSCIGLICHLKIDRTETVEPVPDATEYSHRTSLSRFHYPLIFNRRTGIPSLLHAPTAEITVVSARQSHLANLQAY
nr:unnamed protein product [Spirometra erinaceieuropaei]